MDRIDPPVDEYTLAAYIAGALSAEEHAAVTAYLAENAEARELLQMAYSALQAAQNEEPATLPAAPAAQPRPALRLVDRPAAPPAQPAVRPAPRRVSGLLRYAAAAAIVVGLGIGLRLAFVPPADELRYDPADEKIDVSVRGSLPEVRLAWESVEGADLYRVVVYDLESAEMVAEYEVEQPRLSTGGTEAEDLNEKLSVGTPYVVRVDAVDRTNRIVRSSESVEFTPEP